MGGRLENADIPDYMKHPIILGDHYIVKLLIRNIHEKQTLHGGAQLMIRMLRDEYWILRARDLVRGSIRKCVVCVRHRARPLSQIMGDLPLDRVIPARAVKKIGLDYAGPHKVTAFRGRGQKSRKGYIAIFVCLITRAIHLEFVSDFTAECFLAAFRRFV